MCGNPRIARCLLCALTQAEKTVAGYDEVRSQPGLKIEWIRTRL